jgi:F1F0 ATPase subunit 2
MAMRDLLTLATAWAAGIGLGALFFGGLWWTVRAAVSASQPALWFAGSLLLRTGVVLAGLYWVSGHHWEPMVACLLGFVTARLIVTVLVGRSGRLRMRLPQEASHAP